MKTHYNLTLKSLVGMYLLVFLLPLKAAPLNLATPFPDPDITSNGTYISYDYTAGVGGVLTITGEGSTGTFGAGERFDGVTYGNTSSQFISLPGDPGGATISANPSGPIVTQTPFLLQANFDADGSFLGGSVRVDGYAVDPGCFGACSTTDPFFTGYTSGTILIMDLLNFGFQGYTTGAGDRDSVIFEWTADIIGGDLFDTGMYFGPGGGAVAVGDVFWGTLDRNASGGGSYGSLWDPDNDNTMTAFMSDFVSCTGCEVEMDTFVPVPAAVWLFGSGLLVLGGVARRRYFS